MVADNIKMKFGPQRPQWPIFATVEKNRLVLCFANSLTNKHLIEPVGDRFILSAWIQ